MAWDTPIALNFDTEQPRTVKDRNLILVQGSYEGAGGGRVIGWDLRQSSSIAVDRATFTGFLAPYQQSEAWYTTFTGSYARLAKSAWTLSESAKWKDDNHAGAGDIWLSGTALNTASTGITNATYGKNRGWYIAYFNLNTAGEENEILRCGWNSTASDAAGVSFRIFSSGRVTIYKDGVYRGYGTLSDDKNTGQEWTSLIVLPGRHRELMFIPNQGKGFTFEFPELEGEASPEIVADAKFWFYCPRANGHSMKLQMCPLTFATSGVLVGQQSYFARPPEAADTAYPTDIYYDEAYAGTTSVSMSLREVSSLATTFTPDGIKASCLVRNALTGDGSYTPFVYAGLAGYEVETGVTNDVSECDLLDATTDRALRIGETPDAAGAEVHAIGLARLTDAGLVDPIGHSNRPVSITCDGYTLWEGISLPPEIEGGFEEDCYSVAYDIAPLWKLLEDYEFRYTVPLDGASWQNAVEFIIKAATGFDDADIVIEDPSIIISSEGAQASGQWSLQIEAGDRASYWIERLFTSYAANWFYDFVPKWTTLGTKFVAMSPTTLGTTSVVTLWGTVDEAIAQLEAEGYTTAEATKFHEHRLWRNYRETGIEPEANEVRVTGVNPRNGQPIQSFYVDTASQDPTTAPGSRPENWIGSPRHYTLLEPGLTSQDLVDFSVELLADRLSPKRRMASFDSTFIRLAHNQRFIFKPDRVTLKNVYDGEDVVIRLSGHETDFDCEAAWPFMSRPTSYFGEIVSGSVGWRGSLRASNLEAAKQIAKERQRRPTSFLGVVTAVRTRNATVVSTP